MEGSRELTRSTRVHLACVAFSLAFLITSASGGSTFTALARGAVVGVIAFAVGGWLVRTVLGVVFTAMARDKAAADAAAREKAE